jgi:hypothetical protein
VSLSRREFLGHSLKIGAGAVALGAGGIGGGLLLGGEASGATPLSPAVPSNVQSFVTQPDFHPVGVSIARSSSLPAGTPEYLFLAPRASTLGPLPTGADPGLMICDLDGNLVWWSRRASAGYDPFNFRVQTYQGRPVLTWFQGTIGPGYATGGSYQIANGDYVQIESFKAHNTPSDLHEFIINAEDHALVTSYDPATYSPLVVGHAQIIDIASGDLLFDWPSYPAVPESESYTNPTGGGDYFHINSIDQYPDSTGDLLISARNTSTVYRVSRSTGKIVWRLGGMKSDFSMGPGTAFRFQHDARLLPGETGVSLYDDANPSTEKQSWGKVFNVNETTGSATLRHEFNYTGPDANPSPAYSPNQGNNQLLPNGGHFVQWGDFNYFTEFAPSGGSVIPATVLQGLLPTDTTSYRSFMFDWVGTPPLSDLVLAVLPGAGSGNFVAFVSWNGATEVASWSLAAGTSPSSLTTVALVAKEGFETAIPFTLDGASSFEVTAVSASGTALGRSAVINAG